MTFFFFKKRRNTMFLILLKYRKVFLSQHVQSRWQIININFVLQFVTEVLVLRLEEWTKFTPIQRQKLIKTTQDKKLSKKQSLSENVLFKGLFYEVIKHYGIYCSVIYACWRTCDSGSSATGEVWNS